MRSEPEPFIAWLSTFRYSSLLPNLVHLDADHRLELLVEAISNPNRRRVALILRFESCAETSRASL